MGFVDVPKKKTKQFNERVITSYCEGQMSLYMHNVIALRQLCFYRRFQERFETQFSCIDRERERELYDSLRANKLIVRESRLVAGVVGRKSSPRESKTTRADVYVLRARFNVESAAFRRNNTPGNYPDHYTKLVGSSFAREPHATRSAAPRRACTYIYVWYPRRSGGRRTREIVCIC